MNPGLYVCPQCGEWKAQNATTCKACYLKDKHVFLTCLHCGKEIKRPHSEQAKNIRLHGDTGNAFCNHICYRTYYAEHPKPVEKATGSCKICGKPVVRAGAKYCSMGCYSKRAKVPDTPYTGAWSRERARTKARFKGECAMCGRVKDRVQVHHIDQDAKNHTAVNLVLLCEPCHGYYHKGLRPDVQEILKTHFRALATGS